MAIEDVAYARRRIDKLMDDRLGKIENNQEELGDKIDKLQARLNYLAGILVAVSFFMNLIAPIIIERLFGK